MDMFATDGFALFAHEIDAMYLALLKNTVTDCATADKWFERRGELLMLQTIRAYPQAAVAEFDNFDDLEFEDEPSTGTNPLEE